MVESMAFGRQSADAIQSLLAVHGILVRLFQDFAEESDAEGQVVAQADCLGQEIVRQAICIKCLSQPRQIIGSSCMHDLTDCNAGSQRKSASVATASPSSCTNSSVMQNTESLIHQSVYPWNESNL